MAPPAPTPKPTPKGKPGGVPIWAWAAAAAVGLVIGLVFLRPKSAPAAEAPAGTARPAGAPSSGGVVALPPELLAALGLTPSQVGGDTGNGDGGSTGGTGDSTAVADDGKPNVAADYYAAQGGNIGSQTLEAAVAAANSGQLWGPKTSSAPVVYPDSRPDVKPGGVVVPV